MITTTARRRTTTWSFIIALLSLCLIVIILTTTTTDNNNVDSTILESEQPPSPMSSSQQQQQERPRTVVGGYSNIDNKKSDERLLKVANFALQQHAVRCSNLSDNEVGGESSSRFLCVTPEDVESGIVHAVVLEASRQVVAGLNYKLTIAIYKGSECLGALKNVKIYDRFGELSVTAWGTLKKCDEIQELLNEVVQVEGEEDEEEEKAVQVEESIEEVREEVEPDE